MGVSGTSWHRESAADDDAAAAALACDGVRVEREGEVNLMRGGGERKNGFMVVACLACELTLSADMFAMFTTVPASRVNCFQMPLMRVRLPAPLLFSAAAIYILHLHSGVKPIHVLPQIPSLKL